MAGSSKKKNGNGIDKTTSRRSLSPEDEQTQRRELIDNVMNHWEVEDGPTNPIPEHMRHPGELINWPLPLLQAISDLATDMSGPDGLETFRQRLEESYDGRMKDVEESQLEGVQQSDLDFVRECFELERDEKRAKKGKNPTKNSEPEEGFEDEDDPGDGDDDDDDEDDAPEPGPDRLTGPNCRQSNKGNGRKDDIIASKKSKTPKKYTSAMFDVYKRGIQRCWGVAADKHLVPEGMQTTDNNQRRLRRELQSYGTPKGSVLELLHELAQITQNRQEAAWARITEEFRKRKGNNKRLSNKDVQLTIQHFRNKSQNKGEESGSLSVPQDARPATEPNVGETPPENSHGDVEEAGARPPSHLREQDPQSQHGHDNRARSCERTPSRPHRGRPQSARTQPYVRHPLRPRHNIPDSREDLNLRDALTSLRAARLDLTLAEDNVDIATLNHESAIRIAELEREVTLAALGVRADQEAVAVVRRRIWRMQHAGDDDVEIDEDEEGMQRGDELIDLFGGVEEEEEGGVLLDDGVQQEDEKGDLAE